MLRSQEAVREHSYELEMKFCAGHAECQIRSPETLVEKSKSYQNAQKDKTVTVPIQEMIKLADFELARMHLFYCTALLFIYTSI
jgi:hypothetical protein